MKNKQQDLAQYHTDFFKKYKIIPQTDVYEKVFKNMLQR